MTCCVLSSTRGEFQYLILIWKSLSAVVVDDTIFQGQMISKQACIRDSTMINELDSKGFGEIDGERLLLAQFETLYLLYTKRLVLTKGEKSIDFGTFMSMCKKIDSDILTKFLVYRDLRNRGYVVKDGFGFGSDFRVYERGQFSQKAAKFLVFGLNEGQQENVGKLQKKIDQITQMGKEPIIAVIERRGEIIYYKINHIKFTVNDLQDID